MKKCTDLNSVKEVAGCLLYTDVHRVENYPFLVKHPFTDSTFATIVRNPEENAAINILESESNLNRWREYVAERIDSAESADEIYSRITKPYRLTFMKYAGQYLSEKDFAEMLCSAWITSENPSIKEPDRAAATQYSSMVRKLSTCCPTIIPAMKPQTYITIAMTIMTFAIKLLEVLTSGFCEVVLVSIVYPS